MRKKILVVTSSRADYGLLKPLLEEINLSKKLELKLIVTGSHLSKIHGETFKDIKKDGFKIEKKININTKSSNSLSLTKSMSKTMVGIAEAFTSLKPDLVLILGDRYEILSVATTAMMFRIPIAHLHGGEATRGLIDEAIRHSITKMSHLHFVATDEYKKRVIQLGEEKKSVFQVGAVGLDSIKSLKLLSKLEYEKSIKFKLKKINFLFTYHPVTLEKETSKKNYLEILKALNNWPEAGIIITSPNTDHDSNVIFSLIKKYLEKNKNAIYVKNMGQLRYLSSLKHVDLIIGNSSSGIIEAPSFKIPTINIGDRQGGRVSSDSIINCKNDHLSVSKAIDKGLSEPFRKKIKKAKNLYGNYGASKRIKNILEKISLENILIKNFKDIN